MNTTKVTKWTVLIGIIGFAIIFINEAFIIEWRIDRSEKRVQKSIVKNFEMHEAKFVELVNFVRGLEVKTFAEIEFVKHNRIIFYTHSPFILDSAVIDAPFYDFTTYDVDEDEIQNLDFTLLSDGTALVMYPDTTITTRNWSWYFESISTKPETEKLLDYLGISIKEFDKMKKLIQTVDCEAILFEEDGSFDLRYDGVNWSKYAYFVPAAPLADLKNMKNHLGARYLEKLNDEVYCGFKRNELVDGRVIYSKIRRNTYHN